MIIKVEVHLSALRLVLGGKGNKERWLPWVPEIFQGDLAKKWDFNLRPGNAL